MHKRKGKAVKRQLNHEIYTFALDTVFSSTHTILQGDLYLHSKPKYFFLISLHISLSEQTTQVWRSYNFIISFSFNILLFPSKNTHYNRFLLISTSWTRREGPRCKISFQTQIMVLNPNLMFILVQACNLRTTKH